MKRKLGIVLIVIVALLISIFLHELGHCLACRHNGVEVERIAIGWGPKLTVFTDSYGTKYEIGPLLILGETLPKGEEITLPSFVNQVEISLAGVAFNGLIILFLSPWYFWLRRKWKEKGKDFFSSFLKSIFKVFIVLNFLLLICNLLIPLPAVDSGRLLYLAFAQLVGTKISYWFCTALGVLVMIWLVSFGGFDFFLKRIYRIYGW